MKVLRSQQERKTTPEALVVKQLPLETDVMM